MKLPAPVIEKHDRFFIARDDLLPGGTKRRALVRWLPTLNATHFHYAGSVYGSGGWALAMACHDLGFECTLHLSKSDYHPGWINSSECQIKWYEPQPVLNIQNNIQEDGMVLPLGFDTAEFKIHLSEIFKEIDITSFSEAWLPCVSGVMVQAAIQAWPGTRINAVCVARNHGNIGKATLYQANEKYHQPARELPSYPANIFSDAKLWSFVRQFALKEALIWNTSI